MATSGTYSWNLSRDDMIIRAYQEINVYSKDETISNVTTGDLNFAIYKLNGMLKVWGLDGIKISKRRRAYLFPALNISSYDLGSISGSAHCTNTYVSTTLTAAAATNDTVLTVTSTTGMSVSDFVGIELTSGTRQWTTIVSVDSDTQITITTGLTSAAASTNTIVTYTAKINCPLDIIYGSTLDLKSNNNEIECSPLSHDQYWKLPIKSTPGRPNNLYYDAVLNGSIPHSKKLYLYPTPSNVYQIIAFVYIDQIQDMTGSTNDLDLPQEWEYPVVFNLAAEMAYSLGKFTELEKIQPKADKFYELLKRASSDKTPLRFKIGKN